MCGFRFFALGARPRNLSFRHSALACGHGAFDLVELTGSVLSIRLSFAALGFSLQVLGFTSVPSHWDLGIRFQVLGYIKCLPFML